MYQVYIANWVIIWHLPPFMGTRKLHWIYHPNIPPHSWNLKPCGFLVSPSPLRPAMRVWGSQQCFPSDGPIGVSCWHQLKSFIPSTRGIYSYCICLQRLRRDKTSTWLFFSVKNWVFEHWVKSVRIRIGLQVPMKFQRFFAEHFLM